MPARHVIKPYIENGYYHLYNRGIEKRKIFLGKEDYKAFEYFIERCLSPDLKIQPSGFKNLHNISEELELLSYCLMPNHFHFLIRQNTKNALTMFLRRILTSYVMYFNKKSQREGALFQGKPKAVFIKDEGYLLHLSRYIHLNPSTITKDWRTYAYSSYLDYLRIKNRSWIKPENILGYFKSAQRQSLSDVLSYQSFVENYKEDSKEVLGEITIE